MIRFLLATIIVMLSGPVYSQTIVARSGEHAAFSRIVLPFPKTVEWEMGRFDAGYIIRFVTPIAEIDLSEVFQLIPRTRISNLEFSLPENTLKVFLNCDCHANAFDFTEGKFVLDVLNGPADFDSPFETLLDNPKNEIAGNANVSPQPIIVPVETIEPIQNVQTETDVLSDIEKAKIHALKFAARPKLNVGQPISRLLDTFPNALSTPADTDVAANSNDRVTGMEARLLTQIGRASTQGLLKPNLPVRPSLPSYEINEQESVPSQNVAPIIEPKERENVHIRLQATTSIDQGVIEAFAQNRSIDENSLQSKCLPNEMFDVGSWGNQKSLMSEISKARVRLSSEFDATSIEAVENLAKAYIYASFGSEAIQVLEIHGASLVNYDLLSELALTFDYGNGTQNGILSDQLNCNTAGAMWAILSMPEIPKNHSIALPIVNRSFSELPLHLRRYIGPKLVERFLKLGDRKTAVEIRNAVSRADGKHGDAFTLMDAKLEIAQGKSSGAISQLSEIAGGGSEASIAALVELVKNEIRNDQAIPLSRIESLKALAFELRGSATEAEIVSTLVKAHANSKHYQLAADLLKASSERGLKLPDGNLELFAQVVSGATEELENPKFLEFIFENEASLVSRELPHSLRQRIAARLVNNGFSDIAVTLLGLQKPNDENDVVILARAAINKNEPKKAIELTARYPNNDAAIQIRIKAANLLKDHGLNALEQAKLGDEQAAVEALWRDRDFDAITRKPVSELSNIAALSVSQSGASVESEVEDIQPAALRARLNEIRNSRSVISELLEKFEKPTEGF